MPFDIGMIGLAVMGQNLALNMNDHGFEVAVYNRTTQIMTDFIQQRAQGTKVKGYEKLEEMVKDLKLPRRVIILVQAGKPVDAVIEQLIPLLEKDDIIIDLGNTHFPDTQRRYEYLQGKNLRFIGSGVSGGELGARYGPSIMPGGDKSAWPFVKDIFQAIAAKAGPDPCCDWVGDGGAGHYVKMVHNGIEYGDMQLICEAYQMLHEGLGLTYDELHKVFTEWNAGELDSYLIEITMNIMGYKDEDGTALVDKILDTAGQKGTGKWTGISSLDLGIPVTLIGESVFARCVSYLKDERVRASKVLRGPDQKLAVDDKSKFIEDVRQALYASKMISYAQGYMLMREASKHYKWDLNFGGIALMWRGGCIIRSVFLGKIKEAFDRNPNLENLLLDEFFQTAIAKAQPSWRRIVVAAVNAGIPVPAFATALTFYDGYRRERLPANLLQAQRDYFGAHTYERVDKPRGEFFHTNWTGQGMEGMSGASRTYNV